MAQDSMVSENMKRAMKSNCAATKNCHSVCKALKDDTRTKIDSVEAEKLRFLHRINRTQHTDYSPEQEKGFHGGLTTFLRFPESESPQKSLFPQLKRNAIKSKSTERLEALDLERGSDLCYHPGLATKDGKALGRVRKIGRSQDDLSSLYSLGSTLEHRNNDESKSVEKPVKKLFSSSRHFSSMDDLRQIHQNSKSLISSQFKEGQSVIKGLSHRHRKLSQSLPEIETLASSSAHDARHRISDESISVGKPAETVFFSSGSRKSSSCHSSSIITSQQVDMRRESLCSCHNCLLHRRRKLSKSLSNIASRALATVHNMELKAFERLVNNRETPTKTTNRRLTGVGEKPRALSDPCRVPVPSCGCSLARDAKSKSKPIVACSHPPRRREVCRCPHKIAPPLDASFNSCIFKRKQQSTQSLSQQMDNVKDLRYLRESNV